MKINNYLLAGMLMLLVASPLVSAYATDPKMPNLWDLFVEYTFGNFFISVVGLAALIFVIVGLMGQLSGFSSIAYTVLFMYAMAIGYSSSGLFVVIIFATSFSWAIFQMLRFQNLTDS